MDFINWLRDHIKVTNQSTSQGSIKFYLKCGFIQGSIINGIREPILYSFALSSHRGPKIDKETRVKLF